MAVERGTSGFATMGDSPWKRGRDSLKMFLCRTCLVLLVLCDVLHGTRATSDQGSGLLLPYESGSGALVGPDPSFASGSGALPTEYTDEIPTENKPVEG